MALPFKVYKIEFLKVLEIILEEHYILISLYTRKKIYFNNRNIMIPYFH
jgi:hypothetical protein